MYNFVLHDTLVKKYNNLSLMLIANDNCLIDVASITVQYGNVIYQKLL